MTQRIVRCLLFFALLLAGCATASVGPNAAPDQLSQIRQGQTTKAEVIAALGLPTAEGRDSKNRPMLVWSSLTANANGLVFVPVAGPFLKGSDLRARELKISFDAAGRVADVQTSQETNQRSIFGQ